VIAVVVPDEEQRATGRERCAGDAQGGSPLGRRELEIRDQDEVGDVDPLERQHVADPELDTKPSSLGERSCALDGNGAEVDPLDVPTVLGEPDRIAALSASEVERATWREPLELFADEAVRARPPQQLRCRVPGVPVMRAHALSHP